MIHYSPLVINNFTSCSDMFLNERESSNVLRTWIGQPVKFECSIILKEGSDYPSFRWKNVDKNMTITANVVDEAKKSSLTVIPKSDNDFGRYKCYATTAHTKIKHNMTLLKVGKL